MTAPVSLAALTGTFLRIGLLSFGGPAAQIALMHRTLVDEKGWLGEKQFLDALGFCMLLPGPEAMQLATYAGWRLRGIAGGLIAGLLFVGPGAAVIFALASVYVVFGAVPVVQVLFLGIKAAVLVIVLEALLKVARRALTRPGHRAIAGIAFVAVFFFAVPFPLIIAGAALWGGLSAARQPAATPIPSLRARPSTIAVVATGLLAWFLPLAALTLWGPEILADIGWFFSRLAVVSFGGAYAGLAYMAQDVVTGSGWLTAGQMMDGLGLAETTPGPLILVTQFVGFLAGHGAGGMALAFAAGSLTLWVTFVPCFIWIFAGAPYIERISANPRLAGALGAITAAVVGVILNLSLWFALHVLFGEVRHIVTGPFSLWLPAPASLDWRVIVLALLSGVLLLRLHAGIPLTLLAAAGGALALSAVA